MLTRRRRNRKTFSISVQNTTYNGKRQRGVYSNELIPKGSIIELCPIIVIPGKEQPEALEGYVYGHTDDKHVALALGFGSLYNHSSTPNAKAKNTGKYVRIRALQDIHPGEQILINYGYTKEEFEIFNIEA
jgi:SET domain-containing protein